MAAIACGADPEEEEEAARLMQGMTRALERMVARNERVSLTQDGEEAEEVVLARTSQAERRRQRGLTAFLGTRSPGISVGKYVERLRRLSGCTAPCFVVGFVYIDRAAHRHPASPVVSRNVHRLLLTSLLLASKVLDDAHHNNAFFAKVGGISISELNRLELELLFLLDFGLAVSSRVYESYCWHLERENRSPDRDLSNVSADSDKISKVEPGLTNGSRLALSPSPPCHSIELQAIYLSSQVQVMATTL